MTMTQHLSREALEEGLEEVLRSPHDVGALKLIVRRPETGAREVVDTGELDLADGLVGDNWKTRGSAGTPDGSAQTAQRSEIGRLSSSPQASAMR